MCLSQLLVLVSTLPIGIVMCGPQGPEDQSVSSMNFFDGRPRAQGVNEVARKARHGSQGLLALSTLAAALVLSFLIMRCFIALSPRGNIKQDSGASSRRLSYIPNACSQENLIEDEEKMEKKEKENRSLLKMGLIFGGTIITGLATMAAVYFVTEARKTAALTALTDANPAAGAAGPIGEAAAKMQAKAGAPRIRTARSASLETAKKRLNDQLPSRRVTLKDTRTFDVNKLNQRIVDHFLATALDTRKDEAMIKREFKEFVKHFVEAEFKEMFATDFANLSGEMKRAAELIEANYEKSIGVMTVTTASLRKAEPEEIESLLETAKQRISTPLPSKPFTLNNVHTLELEKLSRRIANYFLTALDLTDEAMMKKEFNEFVKYFVEAEFEKIFATDFANLSGEMKKKAAEIEANYENRIGIMTVTAASLRKAEPEREKEKEKEIEKLMIHLPPSTIGPKELPQRIANYFLVLDEEKLTNEAMRIELIRYANYYLKAANAAATVPNIIDHYEKRISMMVAVAERRHRATREAIKHVTPTVANTVEAIEAGTFKF